MALMDAGGEIGPNSLEMISFEQQEYGDFCAGEILTAAMRAQAEYACTGAPAESFASLGPVVQDTVQQTQELTQANITSQSSITQEMVDSLSAPIITDAEISSAPNAVPVGSGGAQSAFTQGQLDAAGNRPVNWAQTLTIESATRRVQLIRRSKHLQAQRKAEVPPRSSSAVLPAPAWGQVAGAAPSWCSLGSNPWGKLLLFGGLGLIAVGLINRK